MAQLHPGRCCQTLSLGQQKPAKFSKGKCTILDKRGTDWLRGIMLKRGWGLNVDQQCGNWIRQAVYWAVLVMWPANQGKLLFSCTLCWWGHTYGHTYGEAILQQLVSVVLPVATAPLLFEEECWGTVESQGLQHTIKEETLEELHLFSLVKGKIRGNLEAAC